MKHLQLIERNPVLEKLKYGEPVVGCQLRSRSALIAEMLGYCGMEFVFIEAEHFAKDDETIENCIRAVQMGGAVPLVRLSSHEPGRILLALESGAMGVMIPHVDTAEQAKELVKVCKYSPLGKRGFSNFSRATKFGTIPMREYEEMANNNTMLIAMIESLEGVNNVEEIISAGVDMLTVGPCDLSQDMGHLGEQTPEVLEKIAQIAAAAKKAGIPFFGADFNDCEEDFRQSFEDGCSVFNINSDMALLKEVLIERREHFEMFKRNLGFTEE